MKTTHHLLCGLLSAGLMLAASPLNAATLTVATSINGNIRSPNTGKFGDNNFLVGDTGAAGTNRFMNGLIAFDLDLSALNGATIHSVSLTFTSLGDGSTNSTTEVTFDLYLSLREFTNAATWNQSAAGQNWQTPGGTGANDRGELLSSVVLNTADYAGADNLGRELTISSSELLNSVVENDGGTLYLWFGMNPADSVTGARHLLNLASIEHGTLSYQPRLVIDYTPVPEPSTVTLAALSAVGLVYGLARRRRDR